MTKYICNNCTKSYKHRQSLHTHKKTCKDTDNTNNITHVNILNHDNSNLPHNNSDDINSSSKLLNTIISITNNNSTNNNGKKQYICKYCNKSLSRKDNLNRHYKTCKEKDNIKYAFINIINNYNTNKHVSLVINKVLSELTDLVKVEFHKK
jgi:uncharacterized Zn-finger protein